MLWVETMYQVDRFTKEILGKKFRKHYQKNTNLGILGLLIKLLLLSLFESTLPFSNSNCLKNIYFA